MICKNINRLLKKFNLFEWTMILTVIGFTIYFSIIDKESSIYYLIIDGIAAISGIFSVVLCAKGKKSQFIWALFNISGYAIIAGINRYYGEVMLNVLYYLPSQFIGYYLWNKHVDKVDHDVKTKKLGLKTSLLLPIITGVGIFVYKIILDFLGGVGTTLDSLTTVISVAANLLMILRYREQWILWILINIITIIKWFYVGDLVMVTMWSIYLVNSFYGFYNWTRLVNKSKKNR